MNGENRAPMTSTERSRRLRERRAAAQAVALLPVPDAPPRPDDELLVPAAEATIAALGLDERYPVHARMIRLIAKQLDEARDQATAMRLLGPQLRKLLEDVGGTPASRARMPQRAPQRSAPSKLAQLRRQHMDSPAKRKRAAG